MIMSDVHPLLRNAVIGIIWATLLVPLAAFALGLSAYVVRLGIHGRLTTPDVTLDPQTQLLVIVGVLAGIGLLYWIVARETFGSSDVDDAVNSAQDTLESLSDD